MSRLRNWRPLLVGGGALILVGGAMHPDTAVKGLPLREGFASTMASGGWVLSHSTMSVGAAFLAAGIWFARRDRSLAEWRLLMGVVMVAVVANFIELVIHTAVIVDETRLAAGETGALTAIHLVGLMTVYPLYGAAVAVLAWRFARCRPTAMLPISAAGIIGGVCHAISAPLAVLTENSDYEFLFPLAGITVSLWWIGLGLAGTSLAHTISTGHTRVTTNTGATP